MYPKFIINRDGVLRFGHVFLHRKLLAPVERGICGGGLWKPYKYRGAFLLFGRSLHFGAPCFDCVRRVFRSDVGGTELPLFFLPHRPDEDHLTPICIGL